MTRQITIGLLATLVLTINMVRAAGTSGGDPGANAAVHANRINFFVSNRPKTLDLFSRTVIWRARLRGMKHRQDLVIIVASTPEQVQRKIASRLEPTQAVIGTIWFDSHGHYANGYSSFTIGKREYSYKTIHDSAYSRSISLLAPYCDSLTNVVIGSCYSGATFTRKINGEKRPMFGDSLMIGLACLLPGARVYGTESWVMSKPGLFQKHKYAFAGYPLQRRFKDLAYLPVWERMGIWHRYSTRTDLFETVNTVSLSANGKLYIKATGYLQKKNTSKRLRRNLKKLRPDLARL